MLGLTGPQTGTPSVDVINTAWSSGNPASWHESRKVLFLGHMRNSTWGLTWPPHFQIVAGGHSINSCCNELVLSMLFNEWAGAENWPAVRMSGYWILVICSSKLCMVIYNLFCITALLFPPICATNAKPIQNVTAEHFAFCCSKYVDFCNQAYMLRYTVQPRYLNRK